MAVKKKFLALLVLVALITTSVFFFSNKQDNDICGKVVNGKVIECPEEVGTADINDVINDGKQAIIEEMKVGYNDR